MDEEVADMVPSFRLNFNNLQGICKKKELRIPEKHYEDDLRMSINDFFLILKPDFAREIII